jgi:hypothetical protein
MKRGRKPLPKTEIGDRQRRALREAMELEREAQKVHFNLN